MKIIVLAGGLSPERDVSLLSGAGICKTLREMGHQAFLLDVFFGLPCDSDKLEEVFDRPDGGLEISKGISTSVPDLDALRKSRPDQSPSEIGPNVIELCQMADITFMALHGSIGENGKLQATFDNLALHLRQGTHPPLTNRARLLHNTAHTKLHTAQLRTKLSATIFFFVMAAVPFSWIVTAPSCHFVPRFQTDPIRPESMLKATHRQETFDYSHP